MMVLSFSQRNFYVSSLVYRGQAWYDALNERGKGVPT